MHAEFHAMAERKHDCAGLVRNGASLKEGAREAEIGIIGAGVAGLAAGRQRGKEVLCLEATDRIGGRFCARASAGDMDIIRHSYLPAHEVTAEALHIADGRASKEHGVGEDAEHVLSRMYSREENTMRALSSISSLRGIPE